MPFVQPVRSRLRGPSGRAKQNLNQDTQASSRTGLSASARQRAARPSLQDTIIVNIPSPQFSLAKDKIRVLLLEGVNDSALHTMTTAGYCSVTRLSKAQQ